MAYIAGADRTQAVLLPEVLDDYVGADNPVRFLDAFVAQLDLETLGFQRAVPAETGRPAFMVTVLTMHNRADPGRAMSYYRKCPAAIARGRELYIHTTCQPPR